MKPLKPLKQAHVANTKYGMGDHYGSGIKAKLGKIVEGAGVPLATQKKLKKPPKSLA